MKTWFVFVTAVCVVSMGCCLAGVPRKMSYQGKLTDAGGKLVADGSYEMKFSIYNAGTDGDPRWTETWDEGNGRVPVTNGLFQVILGTHNPMDIVFDEAYWLELQVKSGGVYETLSPRQQIVSTGYSFRAERADTADTAGSVAAADITGTISGSQIADGAVTEDKISPETVAFMHRVPIVSGISPDTRDAGYSPFTATITGQNFQSGSQAKIGNVELTGENVTGSTSLTASVPAGLSAGSHDVAVSNINFDWGTGSALFTVNTPTPTATPSPTPTGTPTQTPTPWGQSPCEAAGGKWLALNDGSGESGCWFQGTGGDHKSCSQICTAAGLGCSATNFNDDSSCTIGKNFGHCATECQPCRDEAYAPWTYQSSGGGPTGGCAPRCSGTGQSCAAVQSYEYEAATGHRYCVCRP